MFITSGDWRGKETKWKNYIYIHIISPTTIFFSPIFFSFLCMEGSGLARSLRCNTHHTTVIAIEEL